MKPSSQIAATALGQVRWHQRCRRMGGFNNYQQPSTDPGEAHPAVEDLYRRLLAASGDSPNTEPLTDLDRQLDEHDPELRLATIATRTAELGVLRRQITDAHTRGDAIQRELLDSHLTRIDARLADLADEQRTQRSLLILWNLGSRPNGLADAIDNRTNHLTHHALTTRPAWLTTVITQWHTHHPDNSPDNLHHLVGQIAAWRERTGHTGDDPIGPPPVEPTQYAHWQQLDPTLTPAAEMQISDLL